MINHHSSYVFHGFSAYMQASYLMKIQFMLIFMIRAYYVMFETQYVAQQSAYAMHTTEVLLLFFYDNTP